MHIVPQTRIPSTHPHTHTPAHTTHPHTHTPTHLGRLEKREFFRGLSELITGILVSKSRLMDTLIRGGVEKTLIKT